MKKSLFKMIILKCNPHRALYYTVIVVCFLALAIPSIEMKAQILPDQPHITFQNGKLYLNGSVLKQDDAPGYLSVSMSQRYSRALAAEKVGETLMGVSASIALVSGTIWAVEAAKYRKSVSDIVPPALSYSAIGTVAGILVGTGGLATYLIGQNSVKRIYETYLAGTNSSALGLDLGFTSSGVSLALRF